jgi:hypothetical protein
MRKARFLLGVFAILCLFAVAATIPAYADSQPVLHPTVVGQVGGVTNAVAYYDSYIYFNVGPRLASMAISSAQPGQPFKPQRYGAVLPGVPQDIKVANGYLYLALGSAGVAVVNPGTLGIVGYAALPEDAQGSGADAVMSVSNIAVASRYLYGAAGISGIVAYDLGPSKNQPTYVKTTTFANPVRIITDVEYAPGADSGSAGTLYASANNNAVDPALRGGVMKFDLSNSATLNPPTKVRGQIDVNALQVGGGYVYAAGNAAFYVLDTAELAIQNGNFLLGSIPVRLMFGEDEDTLYMISTGGVEVLNISTPTAPVALTAAPFVTPGAAADLVVLKFGDDVYLYIADFDAGLSIARSSAATPGIIELVSGSYVVSGAPIVRSVAAVPGQAFLSGSAPLLWTADTRQPAAMSLIGSGVAMSTTVTAMQVHENWLFGTAGTAGLLRYAIHEGAEPAEMESYTTGGTAVALALAWPNIVVADGTNGLVVVNGDGTLALTGEAPAPEFNSNFIGVDVSGSYAYVVDGNGTFRVYDLTDPTGPVALGTLKLGGMLDVKVAGNYAYLACGTKGLRVVDISDPNAPTLVGTDFLDLPGVAQNLLVYDGYLLVAAGEAGAHMLSMEPGGQLVPVLSFFFGGSTLRLIKDSGGFLYAANENGGMAMFMLEQYQVYLPKIAQRIPGKVYFPVVRKR